MQIPDIQTARLRLVAITPQLLALQEKNPQELSSLLSAVIPPDWPGPDWEAHVYEFIRAQFRDSPHTIGWHRYVLLSGPQTIAIGTLGAHPRGATEAEIGYGILHPWRRKGHATEASRALIAFLFSQGNRRLLAQTFADHTSSLRVMERCGMSYSGAGQEAGCVSYSVDCEAFETAVVNSS